MSQPSNYTNMNPTIPVGQGIHEESTTAKTRIGYEIAVGETKYRYARAGTALGAGDLLVHINNTAVNKSSVGAAVIVGTFKVPVYAASDQTANAFADSYLVVMDSGGQGIQYRIKQHGAITATTAGQLITLYDPIASGGAMTTATKIAIVVNPYANMVSATSVNATSPVFGAAPIAVTSGNYFWAAVEGPTVVKAGSAISYGIKVSASTTGGAAPIDATANATADVGVSLTLTGTAADSVLVWLSCPR